VPQHDDTFSSSGLWSIRRQARGTRHATNPSGGPSLFNNSGGDSNKGNLYDLYGIEKMRV